jgi:hypothetical protein
MDVFLSKLFHSVKYTVRKAKYLFRSINKVSIKSFTLNEGREC